MTVSTATCPAKVQSEAPTRNPREACTTEVLNEVFKMNQRNANYCISAGRLLGSLLVLVNAAR